ncbi:MAG: putative rRNA maturation factor [Kangiellaceae bacterium]|jgi:probable rRNA maturation factor
MNNAFVVDIQIADDVPPAIQLSIPNEDTICTWLRMAYAMVGESYGNKKTSARDLTPEISVRIVSMNESAYLNSQYRGKDKPTNVLSFESDLPEFVPSAFLGDLVICAQIVNNEAAQQHKPPQHHWAHMCIHGMLHLVGFDHIDSNDALEMESLEINILAKLGIDDPYQIS